MENSQNTMLTHWKDRVTMLEESYQSDLRHAVCDFFVEYRRAFASGSAQSTLVNGKEAKERLL